MGILTASNLANHFMQIDPFTEHGLNFKRDMSELINVALPERAEGFITE
jgi:hypothetical protein